MPFQHQCFVTVTVTVVVCVFPPPFPVTVIVDVPSAALLPAAIVIVEVPEPGAATVAGLKLTVTPRGWPEADSAIDELKPFNAVVVIVEVPEVRRATVTALGEALMLKSAPAVNTVRETAVVCVTPAPVPVTVIV